MPFHSLPGVQLLCTGKNLPQATCHSHQPHTDGPVPAEDPKWCYVPLHWQLNGTCAGSALQNQKQTQTLVQVGNARWGCLHPDCRMSLLGTRAATVALTCWLLILLFGLNSQLHNWAWGSPCFKCTHYSLPRKRMSGPKVHAARAGQSVVFFPCEIC